MKPTTGSRGHKQENAWSLRAYVVLCSAMGLLILGGSFVPADEEATGADQIVVEVSVDRSVITIGDLIRYEVQIIAGEGVEIPTARFHPDLHEFEILDFSLAEQPRKEGNQRIWVDEYVISTYATGDYTIPPYRLSYRVVTEGEEAQELEASSGPVRIEVKSVTAEESEAADIEDIKPPVPIESPGKWWIVLLIGLGVAGAVCGLLVYLRFRRRGKEKEAAPPLPPHELALLELEALRGSEIVFEARAEQFSVAVSAIIRSYVEGRFGIPALERTTDETLEALQDHPVGADHTEAFGHFFDSCDLVKFGGDLFQWDDLHVVIDEAENLVRETMPIQEAAPVADAGASEGETPGGEVASEGKNDINEI